MLFRSYARECSFVISSSALQWSNNLESTLKKIRDFSKNGIFISIFTSKSMEELHDFLGTKSPLRDKNHLERIFQEIFIGFDFELYYKRYEQRFSSRKDMLEYIKNSGLTGGGRLDFAQSKRLKNSAPFERLEFEVLFFKAKIK